MKCHCHRHLSGLGDKRKCLLNFGGKTSCKAHMGKLKHDIEYSRKQTHFIFSCFEEYTNSKSHFNDTRHLEGWKFVQSS